MGIMDAEPMVDQVKVFLGSCTTRDLLRLMQVGFEELEGRGHFFLLLQTDGDEAKGFRQLASRVSAHLVTTFGMERRRRPRKDEVHSLSDTDGPAGSEPVQINPV